MFDSVSRHLQDVFNSVMRPPVFYSRGRNTSASVSVTVTVNDMRVS